MTRTGKSPRLAGHRPEPLLELHPGDAAVRGLVTGDIAEVESDWGRAVLRVHRSETTRRGEVFAPMHWTRQLSRAGAVNSAVNPPVDPISGQPELKHTPVEVRPVKVVWHGTILARRPIMMPELAYWTRLTGAGFYTYLVAGDQPIDAARRQLSAALRAANPGPLLEGAAGVSAVVGDGVVEGVLTLAPDYDEAARDRLAPFMSMGRLSVEQRNALLHGGDGADRGGELCACLGVSCATVEAAIADGASTLDTVGEVTKAGTNCGSCRPEIRALLRGRLRKAA
jgi:assimilatory nitrate reductase catalytic subunit